MKTGTSVGLFRVRFEGYKWVPSIDAEFNNGSLFDYHSAEAGHEYYLIDPVEYVRDNSLVLGASTAVPVGSLFSVRMYAEAELPKNPSWLRPFVHVPADYENPVNESSRPTLIDRIGGTSIDGEQFPQHQLDEEQELKRTANGSYKAWRIHSGVEVRLNLDFGALFLAGDVQFHQDGQTKHMPGQYSPSNPWEKEFTIDTGMDLGRFVPGKNVRIELAYHNGRVNGTDFFCQRIKVISLGMSIS